MKIALSHSAGLIKRFRRTPWRFQHTFVTPLKSLQPFVSTIISTLQPLKSGAVTIDTVVFEPKHLLTLVATDSSPQFVHDHTLSAVGADQTEALLRATLHDWIDFVFIPVPKPFAIYADHDEFCTFYAHSKSNLNRVVMPLSRLGFESTSSPTPRSMTPSNCLRSADSVRPSRCASARSLIFVT